MSESVMPASLKGRERGPAPTHSSRRQDTRMETRCPHTRPRFAEAIAYIPRTLASSRALYIHTYIHTYVHTYMHTSFAHTCSFAIYALYTHKPLKRNRFSPRHFSCQFLPPHKYDHKQGWNKCVCAAQVCGVPLQHTHSNASCQHTQHARTHIRAQHVSIHRMHAHCSE